jgi:transcription elongation GreA/GreB family factor
MRKQTRTATLVILSRFSELLNNLESENNKDLAHELIIRIKEVSFIIVNANIMQDDRSSKRNILKTTEQYLARLNYKKDKEIMNHLQTFKKLL